MSASLFGALAVVVLVLGAALPFAIVTLVFDVRSRIRRRSSSD